MSQNRLTDYLAHMHQAAQDACDFVDGQIKEDFFADKCTQQAVIMSLVIIGEAATKVMDGYADFATAHPEVPRAACVACAIALHISASDYPVLAPAGVGRDRDPRRRLNFNVLALSYEH